jgi:serine/threonine protein phosphatase PrpC
MDPHHRNTAPDARLKWSGRTDCGPKRPNNEDAFLGLRFDGREVHHLGSFGEASTHASDFAFAVSDGMGGARAGELASRITVDKIVTLLPRSFRQAAAGLDAGFEDVLMELFDQVHRTLAYVGSSYHECSGMEATLSLCWFTPGWMFFGHVGDSRIYYLPGREGGIKQLTQDDTHVAWLLRHGKITESEARRHPRRNVLQKSLGGSNQFVDPQVGAVACERGDVFLLCTDGLIKGLHNEHLAELLRANGSANANDGEHAARRLVEEAIARDGSDNTTALVIQVC